VPIGFFDSGVGGLSILRHTISAMPSTDFIYIADSANCPWGEKDNDFIDNRSVELTEFLLSKGVSMVVVACNSASTNSIEMLRKKFPKTPFVGVEPGIKPALLQTKKGRVAVLATRATSRGEKFLDTKKRFSGRGRVLVIPAPELVEWIEKGYSLSFCQKARLAEILDPAVQTGVDQLVLGCTHFPFLLSEIKECLSDGVNIIDTSSAVSRRIEEVAKSVMNTNENGTLTFYTSADTNKMDKLLTQLIGIENVESKKIEK
jgi:glutamate racemase